MDLKEIIRKRRSCRSFTGVPVNETIIETIRQFRMRPLYPEIQTRWEILPREQVKCICPWTTPQVIAVYSEKKDGYLENVGFLFQQLDLYLQSLGLGVCWLGMGKLDEKVAPAVENMDFVIMLAFGHPKGSATEENRKFHRKSLAAIADREDKRLEPARIAPSSVNSQPWYFTHEDDVLHAYCAQRGILKAAMLEINRIDMGIALAHLLVSNPDTFRFFRADAPSLKGYGYIGSITI